MYIKADRGCVWGENMKEQRIIINYNNVKEPMKYVQNVINGGLISGNGTCYCYHTQFKGGAHVSCKKLKNGYSFKVWI